MPNVSYWSTTITSSFRLYYSIPVKYFPVKTHLFFNILCLTPQLNSWLSQKKILTNFRAVPEDKLKKNWGFFEKLSCINN